MTVQKVFTDGKGSAYYEVTVTLSLEADDDEGEGRLKEGVQTLLNDISDSMDYGTVGPIYYKGGRIE